MSTTISPLYLLEVATGDFIEGELRDAIEPANVLDWQMHWQPALIAFLKDLIDQGIPPNEWPQSRYWNWQRKLNAVQGLLGSKGASVTCQGTTQGLMLLDLTRTSRLAVGKPLVYIDFLEVAPWNWSHAKQLPRYKGVGMALVSAATQLSIDESFKGRLGLHSLPQSEEFYRNKCKMTDLGPDPAYQNLRYFEMTIDQAQTFVGKEA